MERHVTLAVGVIVERRAVDSPWQSHAWCVADAIIGEAPLPPGSRLRQDSAVAAYFAGTAILELHPTDIASYRENLRQETPRLYVVLSEPNGGEPPRVHLVTAAPDEAECYLDGDPSLVDGVPMPHPLVAVIQTYTDTFGGSASEDGELSRRRFRKAHSHDGLEGPQ
jgi:hypothetical protein